MGRSSEEQENNKTVAHDPLSWRRRRNVIGLENFDHPQFHRRARFDADTILALASPRMAGFDPKMTPMQVRDALHEGHFATDEVRSYIRELFEQFNGLDIRRFRHACGASLYELARAMIACNVNHPFVAEWMNCQSPNYEPPERKHHIYRMSQYRE